MNKWTYTAQLSALAQACPAYYRNINAGIQAEEHLHTHTHTHTHTHIERETYTAVCFQALGNLPIKSNSQASKANSTPPEIIPLSNQEGL